MNEESNRGAAVNDAMVIRQSEVHHRAEHDIARMVRIFDRPIGNAVQAENAGLRWVENRRGHH